MINCMNCVWSVQLDPARQCKIASPEIKECEHFEGKFKTLKGQIKEMLED